jgi:tetratricopeptide (TPR) repeat protein
MEFYERYNPGRMLLDSALNYLDRQQGDEAKLRQNQDYIRAYFLRSEPDRVISYAAALTPGSITDAWTCYRIGEAFMQKGSPQPALPWYQRAVAIWPRALDFQNKLGNCFLALNDLSSAEKTFRVILAENPKYALALGNLGFIFLQRNELAPAFDYFLQAVALDPDREQTLINLAVVYHGQGNMPKARNVLEALLRRHPDNAQAKAMLADLGRGA